MKKITDCHQPRIDDTAGGAVGGDPERAQPLGEHAGVPQVTGPATYALCPPVNRAFNLNHQGVIA